MKLKIILLFILYTMGIFGQNIYVVYDDSGSMKKDDRWVYANYAMQNLVSMLNKEDKIFLTKMSDYKNEFKNTKEINLNNLEKELLDIEKSLKHPSKITPYSSVEYAIQSMKQKFYRNESNWLIVITDGEFEDGEALGLSRIEEIKKSIEDLMEKTATRPVFLVIGSDSNEIENIKNQEGIALWKDVLGEGDYPKIITSQGKEDIINKVEEVAFLITAKSGKDSNATLEIKDNKIKFFAPIPLKRIIVLEQTTENNPINRIKNIKNEKELDFEKQYTSNMSFKNIKLKSFITPIKTNDKTSINGETIIEFDRNIENKIKLVYEANAKFQVEIYDENNEIIDERFIEDFARKKIKIKGQLLDLEKNSSLIHNPNIVVKARYGNEETQLFYNPTTLLYEGDIIIGIGKRSIDASAEFPGYFDFQSEIYTVVGIEHPCPINLTLEECQCILEPENCPEPPEPRKLGLNFAKFPNQEDFKQSNFETVKIVITPTIDGESVKTKDLKTLEFKFNTTLSGETILKRDNNDVVTWEFIPKSHTGISRFKNPKGIFKYSGKITGEENDISAEINGNIKITMGNFFKVWGGLIMSLILPILGALTVFGYIAKKRFNKNAEILVEKKTDSYQYPNTKTKLKGSILDMLVPYRSQRAEINDKIKYIADGKNAVKIKGNNLKQLFSGKGIKKLYINRELIDNTDKSFGVKDYRLFNGDSIEVHYNADNAIRKYTYFYKK